MNGIAASRSDSVGEALVTSSQSRTPIRTLRSSSRLRKPGATSSPTSRDAVATCRAERRAISETVSAGSS
jgi:hypothetical protein